MDKVQKISVYSADLEMDKKELWGDKRLFLKIIQHT